MGFINVKNPVPIYVGANLPKAIRVVGEVGDGWITVGGGSGNDRQRTFRIPIRKRRWAVTGEI